MLEASLEILRTFFLGTAVVLLLILGLLAIIVHSYRQQTKAQNERVRLLEESEKKAKALLEQSEAMQRNLAQFSQEIIRVQEEERSFISRELHDQIGQLLATISMNLEVIQKDFRNPDALFEKRIKDSKELIQEMFNRVHGVLSELRAVALSQFGFLGTTRNFIEEFSNRTGIDVQLSAVGGIEKLSSEQKLALYRVVQESLNNVLLHAHAVNVKIDMSNHNSTVHVSIEDDGRGFDVSVLKNPPEGTDVPFGLLGMQERIKLIHGKFDIVSERGKGTAINIDVPLQNNNGKGHN